MKDRVHIRTSYLNVIPRSIIPRPLLSKIGQVSVENSL